MQVQGHGRQRLLIPPLILRASYFQILESSVELDQEISILSEPVVDSTQLEMEAVELSLLTAHPFQ